MSQSVGQPTATRRTPSQAASQPAIVRRRRDLWLVFGGLGLLGLCMAVVRNGDVGAVEEAVFLALNGLPDWLKTPMWLFQLFGMLAVVALCAVAAAVARRYRLALVVAAAIPLKLAMEWWVVKALVERERPAFTVAEAVIRESNTNRLGFPSGHSVFAFTLAGLLAPYFGRRGTIVLYGLAVLNGVARIYLGAHNPLDIVAGAGLGIAIAAALNLLAGVPAAERERKVPA